MPGITRRAALGFYLTPWVANCQSGPAAGDEWNAFLEWANALPPDTFPASGSALFNAYKMKLTQGGVTAADQVVARLREYALTNPGFSTVFFNKHYAKRDPIYASGPNAFLVEVARGLRPGRAMDVGMGEGRNAIFLAQRGWNVTGIDLAEVGVAKAKKRAADLGVKLNAFVQDADRFDFGTNQWDLVCLLYFSGSMYVHDFEKRIANGLKPGGYIIGEGPETNPKDLTDGLEVWEPWGITLLRLEYRANKADWGQPGFDRILLRKGSR
jgi:SAM-dependent methyltransferase